MERKITRAIHYMANSHLHLARLLEAKRSEAEQAARLLIAIPHDKNADPDGMMEQSMVVAKSVGGYLNSLADLEFALADNLAFVIKELNQEEEDDD
ncbi:hypothetical protein J31TS4_24170 [Paenibacillus sp. J31TS4]|uniref:nucleoside-diphosphate sugar epimerase n=1 Tax=Paenibacillus sp. J31TS4 TaxID=2807195 RepID=UPI001B107203|nr:nucleoside-diphosphate sugar epimerase [Paenibacillus sp. J31TS4]GIP39137.1 hypothetical protein J31TS4_24170 [Paenibacillus sp. J31TS4]